MGGGGGKSKRVSAAPAPPPPPVVEPQAIAEQESIEVKNAREEAKKASLRARGHSSTILTGSLGDTTRASVERKTLLGQ